VDVAYGGMWYAIADAAALGFAIEPRRGARPVAGGERIRARRARAAPVRPSREPRDRRREHRPDRRAVAGRRRRRENAVVVAPGRLDRSATGTGSRPGWQSFTLAG
jgi:proline racemase